MLICCLYSSSYDNLCDNYNRMSGGRFCYVLSMTYLCRVEIHDVGITLTRRFGSADLECNTQLSNHDCNSHYINI